VDNVDNVDKQGKRSNSVKKW